MMKKALLSIVFLIFAVCYVQSQGFYARAAMGGGISTSSNFNMLYKYDTDGGKQTVQVVPVSLGSGFTGGAAFGYMFKKYLGVELMVSGFFGLNTTGDSVVNIPGAANSEVTLGGSLVSMIPSVVITAGLDKINPYARFGLLIGAFPWLTVQHTNTNASINPPQKTETKVQYLGGVSLGYAAAGGVDININKLITIFVEVSFMHSTWSPSYSEVTEYSIDGVDKLSTLTEKQKKTEYYVSLDLNETIPTTSPNKALRKTIPFSTAGAMFGVKFKF